MKTFIFFVTGIALCFSQFCAGQSISLSAPIDRSVVQRNNSGTTSVWVTGQFLNVPSQFTNAQYEVLQLNTQTGNVTGTAQAWSGFSADQYGLFRFSVSLSAGWYQINVQATVNGSVQSASAKVGVGDVFYIAGQSNAQGVTNTSTVNQAAYDGVVADQSYENCQMQMPRFPYMQSIQQNYGIGTQGPTSWCYSVLGNYLVDNAGGFPVAFFNGGQSATYIQNWLDAADNQPTYYWFNGSRNVCASDPGQNSYYIGQPYRAFKNLLNLQGGLFGARGVIWHQGEADNQQGTTTTEYEGRFNTLVQRFRSEVGNYSLPCWIAKATYDESRNGLSDAKGNPAHNSPVWEPVRMAQGNTSGQAPNQPGPDTDQIANDETVGSPNHRPDGVHFDGEQLRTLGTQWASSINSNLTQTSPTLAQMPPPIQITYNGSNQYTASVVSFPGQYFWTSAASDAIRLDPNNPTGSSQVLSGGQAYRCYVKTSQGTYAVSQVVRAPSGSFRTGVAGAEGDGENPLALRIYPNPAGSQTSISFTLAQPMAVRLELVDASGHLVRIIADNHHAEGSFIYPLDLAQLPAGALFCRLKANDVFITRKILKN